MPGRRQPTVLVGNPSADLFGSDRMMLESVRGMRERGWRVVVTASVDGPLLDRLHAVGAETVVLPVPVVRRSHLSPAGLLTLLREVCAAIRPMRAVLRDVRPSAVYVSTLTVPMWLPLAALRRIPRVVHVHEAEGASSLLQRLALNLPNVVASHVIYNSRTSRDLGHFGALRRVPSSVVYNGVEGPDRIEAPPEDLATVDLLYVGRLSPRKGVDVAVRALDELRTKGVLARLVLVGSVFPGYEWYEQQLVDLVTDLGLTDHVDFAGFQSNVWPWLERCHVVIVPSRWSESFGNVVIEGALAGRPTVVAEQDGLREAASNFGSARVVAIDDPLAVAVAIADLISEWGDARTCAERDAETARERFSPQRYRREIVQIIGKQMRLRDREI